MDLSTLSETRVGAGNAPLESGRLGGYGVARLMLESTAGRSHQWGPCGPLD